MTNELWPYTSADPFCTHCGTVPRALINWPQKVHDTCPCICHQNKTTKAITAAPKRKGKSKRG